MLFRSGKYEKLAFWLAVKVYSSLLLTLTPFEYQPSNLYPSSALATRVTFLPFSYLPSPSASPPPLELVLIIQREAVVCLVVFSVVDSVVLSVVFFSVVLYLSLVESDCVEILVRFEDVVLSLFLL